MEKILFVGESAGRAGHAPRIKDRKGRQPAHIWPRQISFKSRFNLTNSRFNRFVCHSAWITKRISNSYIISTKRFLSLGKCIFESSLILRRCSSAISQKSAKSTAMPLIKSFVDLGEAVDKILVNSSVSFLIRRIIDKSTFLAIFLKYEELLA